MSTRRVTSFVLPGSWQRSLLAGQARDLCAQHRQWVDDCRASQSRLDRWCLLVLDGCQMLWDTRSQLLWLNLGAQPISASPTLTVAQAGPWCAQQSFGGLSGWRLPSADELWACSTAGGFPLCPAGSRHILSEVYWLVQSGRMNLDGSGPNAADAAGRVLLCHDLLTGRLPLPDRADSLHGRVRQFAPASDRHAASGLELLLERGQPPQPLSKGLLPFASFRDLPDSPEMVVIPAGSFQMGGHGHKDEKPIHTVTLATPFAIGKYAITFDDYDAFCRVTDRALPADEGWGRDRRPVINVNWHDVQAYAVWLSQKTGQTYRLPTEAEWEYACRAGTTTEYPWGDSEDYSRANYGYQTNGTNPVGSFPTNPWGLHDMNGNIWEWCEDRMNNNYNGAPTNGSAWINEGSENRMWRGGSWRDDSNCSRSAFRNNSSPNSRHWHLGARLVRTLF